MRNIEKPTTKARRDRGAGSLYQQPGSKTWTIQYYRPGVRMQGGKPAMDGAGKPIPARVRVREATGFTSKREAQELLNLRLTMCRENKLPPKRKCLSIEELVEGVRTEYRLKRKHGALKGLEWRWRHLKSFFVGVLADNVSAEHIDAYVQHRRKEGAADATINRELATLRHAYRLGSWRVRTPPRITLAKERNRRKGFVENEKFQALMSQTMDLWLRVFLVLGYEYGWRRGELLNLRVRDINFQEKTIRIEPGETKNEEGREVGMTKEAEKYLRAAVEGKCGSDYVLTRAGNRPVRDMRKAWWNLCIAAGAGEFICRACSGPWTGEECASCSGLQRKYRGLIAHDLRRSAAKKMRRADISESLIMHTGGWKTRKMFDHYAIPSSQDNQDVVEKLERLREREGFGLNSALISAKPHRDVSEPVN